MSNPRQPSLPASDSGAPRGSYLLLLVVLALFCLLIRAQQLLALPIFGDEAIYLRWAQLVRAGHPWVSLADPKPPLHFWLLAAIYPLTADPLLADDDTLPPLQGITALTPGLPNRVHLAQPPATVPLNGARQPAVTLTDRSAFIGPDWGYAGYPVAADGATTGQWFTNYADEARGAVKTPLGLADATPP